MLLTSGDGFLGAGWFDGIELEPLLTGIGELIDINTYFDPEQILHLSAGEHAIRSVRLFDAAGRVVHADIVAPGNTALATRDLRQAGHRPALFDTTRARPWRSRGSDSGLSRSPGV